MRIVKFLACNGRVSIICSDTKELTKYIRKLHNLTDTTTVAMGRFLTISVMIAHTEIKEETDRLTIQLNGNGLTGSLISVNRINGTKAILKGYIQNPEVELFNKDGTINVGGAVGKDGYLNIIKNNDFTYQGYKGVASLVSGEISDDFSSYYNNSTQKSTYLLADVLVDNNEILASGGYIISFMPDAIQKDYIQIENSLKIAPSITKMLEENKSLEEIARIITGDSDINVIEDDLSVVYECDCSKEKIRNALYSIGKKELSKIIKEDGKANIVCHYCNKSYDFTKEELENIIKELN